MQWVYTVAFAAASAYGGGQRWYVGKTDNKTNRKKQHRDGQGEGADWTSQGEWTGKENWTGRWVEDAAAGREELRRFMDKAAAEEGLDTLLRGPLRVRGACFSVPYAPVLPAYVALRAFWPSERRGQDELMDQVGALYPDIVGKQLRNKRLGGVWPSKGGAAWHKEKKDAETWAEEQHTARQATRLQAETAKEKAAQKAAAENRKKEKAAASAAKKTAKEKAKATKAKQTAAKKVAETNAKAVKAAKKATKQTARKKSEEKAEKARQRRESEKARDRSDRTQVGRTRTDEQAERNRTKVQERKGKLQKQVDKRAERNARYHANKKKKTKAQQQKAKTEAPQAGRKGKK